MSETLYNDIRSALMARLADMPDLPDVAGENKEYRPVVGTPYLLPSVMWAEGSQAELGESGRNWERGIFQVMCVYPDDSGVSAVNTMAGKLREWFKRGTVLSYNGVDVTIRKVYLGPLMIESVSVKQPVSIAFYCQAAN